ncbi:MAG: hypothetical protein HKN33_06275 [Pyrinomonadaceae bacterium]|nr:hypothetical protein [Pyrinomonadaceae bacterium]
MRNQFGRGQESRFEVDLDNDTVVEVSADSPDQIALVRSRSGEAVSALPVSNPSLQGSFDMEVSYLPSDEHLVAALQLLRENCLDRPEFSAATRFLGSVSDYSERTRVLALDGSTLALSDLDLFDWLVNAEREMYLGTDNHPVFEMPLEETACSFTRLPNGQVAMTEASRESVNSTSAAMKTIFGADVVSQHNLGIETRTRSAARYYLTAVPKGVATTKAGRETELTAFLLISRAGFSYGLWSNATGLVSEYAFLAPVEIDRPSTNQAAAGKGKPDSHLRAYVRHALDQVAQQILPERLEELELSKYAEVVWACDRELESSVKEVVDEYAGTAGLSCTPMGVPVNEAVVGGLLFGSFTFGDDTVVGAETLPQVNLARDLLVLADKEEVKRRRINEMRHQQRRRKAVFTLLAAPVVVFAFLFGVLADHLTTQTLLKFRDLRADAKTAELKPALQRRTAYEANLRWYQEFIKQVSRLRKHQPVGIGMLLKLNESYPFELDGSFYVEELKLKPDAGIEITGLARNKDAVTAFLRSLEFAGGAESGSRLFSNLTYEVKEGVAIPADAVGQNSTVPKLDNSTLKGDGPAPGIIAWTIRGNYLPMSEFLPPEKQIVPAGAVPAPAQPAPPAGQPQQPPGAAETPLPAG